MAHLLVTFLCGIGSAAAPPEQASFGLRFSGAVDPGTFDSTREVQQTLTDEMRDKTMAAWPTLAISNAVQLQRLKSYRIDDATGLAMDEVVESVVPTLTQGSGSTRLPNQCALAVTLDAGFPAAGRYGRFYLPPQSLGVAADGRIAAAERDGLLAATKTWLDNLANPSGADALDLIIYSRRTRTKRDVKSIRIGRVIDTQRRRRGSLAEEYAVADLA